MSTDNKKTFSKTVNEPLIGGFDWKYYFIVNELLCHLFLSFFMPRLY